MMLPPSAGVIGWPVAHSKSPLIHRFWLAKLGIDGDYGRFPVNPDALSAAIAGLPALGLRGVNVTVPHKVAVMDHLDRVTPLAQRVGAVNTVVDDEGRLTGHNTDVDGVLQPLSDVDLAGRAAIVVGAGGAARAVLVALASKGIGRVTMINRSIAKAEALLAELGQVGEVHGFDVALPPAALLVNASSLGMNGAPPLDLDLSPMPDDATVFDAVYAPLETRLLLAARVRGLRTIDGLAMLIGQAAAAFELFYGVAAPREHDAELRALLAK